MIREFIKELIIAFYTFLFSDFCFDILLPLLFLFFILYSIYAIVYSIYDMFFTYDIFIDIWQKSHFPKFVEAFRKSQNINSLVYINRSKFSGFVSVVDKPDNTYYFESIIDKNKIDSFKIYSNKNSKLLLNYNRNESNKSHTFFEYFRLFYITFKLDDKYIDLSFEEMKGDN